MKKLRKSIIFSIGLGVLSIVAIVISHLALTDIGHGEGDLTLEWQALQVAFAVIILFHISAFITLFRVLKYTKSSANTLTDSQSNPKRQTVER